MSLYEELAAGDATIQGKYRDRLSARLTEAFEMTVAKEVANASAAMEQLLAATSSDFMKVDNRIAFVNGCTSLITIVYPIPYANTFIYL